MVLAQESASKLGVEIDLDQPSLLDEIVTGLQNFILLSGAMWKAGAFEKALSDMGLQVSLVEAFRGVERPELKTTNTQAIVDKKFKEQLGDYVNWLNGLDEGNLNRVFARSGNTRTFSAMDVNSVLNDELPMNKQPWQAEADKLPNVKRRAEYTRQVTNMFRSQARKISGLGDHELANQSVPMGLDLNVVERFQVYKFQRSKNGMYEARPISPSVYVKNKGFVKFNAKFDPDGNLWNYYVGGIGSHDVVDDYFREFNSFEAGRDLGDIPYGLAWEYFLNFLTTDTQLGIDFAKTLDVPDSFGSGHSCIKAMADGYHKYGVEQAINSLRNAVGKRPDTEIVIWNYPKPDRK